MLYIVGKLPAALKQYLDDHSITFGQFISLTPQRRDHYMVAVDLRSPQALLHSLRELHLTTLPSAIMVAGYEQYVVPAAYIAQYFGVPGYTPKAAAAATDKLMMRKRLPADISPAFTVAGSLDDAISFADTHGYSVMLKPTNLMKSLLIHRCDDQTMLRQAYREITETLPRLRQKLRVMQPTRVIIEQYMTGSMHTVAGFVSASGVVTLVPQISDCLTAHDIGKDDSYLFSRTTPSRLAPDIQADILIVAEQGVMALGLRASPVHVEIMLTASGPKIIEIGARLGGYRPHMYQAAFGIDLYAGAIATAHGIALNIAVRHDRYCSVVELFPQQTGRYEGLTNEVMLRDLPSFKSLHLKADTTKLVGPAKHGYKAAAIIYLEAIDSKVLHQDIDIIRQRVTVTSRPPDDTPSK